MSANQKFILAMIAGVGFIIILSSIASGPKKIPVGKEADIEGWQIIQSPITGKCYETFSYANVSGNVGHGFMGMSEVDCKYFK